MLGDCVYADDCEPLPDWGVDIANDFGVNVFDDWDCDGLELEFLLEAGVSSTLGRLLFKLDEGVGVDIFFASGVESWQTGVVAIGSFLNGVPPLFDDLPGRDATSSMKPSSSSCLVLCLAA